MRMKTPTLSMCGVCMGDRDPKWTYASHAELTETECRIEIPFA